MRRIALDRLNEIWNQVISLLQIYIHGGKRFLHLVSALHQPVIRANQKDYDN